MAAQQNEQILKGEPAPTLLRFALPIISANVFQQLYNIVDALVVGQFLGDIALGGISAAAPIMDLANALIIGATLGVSVLTARLCGAGEFARLKRVNSTALLGGSAAALLLALLGLTLSLPLLRAQGTAPEVAQEAGLYLTVIFSGLICCFLYNYFAALLRSYGNSRTPFLILLISSTLHAALDLLLVGVFRFGIGGVAVSTVACQLFSALCCMVYTARRCPALWLKRKELCFDRQEIGLIFSFAWAAALQQAVVFLGRLIIQGMLTPLGTSTFTGYNMGMRSESFLFCFSQGICSAMVVCMSQNLGNHNIWRLKRFFRCGLIFVWSFALLAAAGFTLFPRQIIGIFSHNPQVIAAGAKYISTMAFLYSAAFTGEALQSFFRGLGRMRITVFASTGQVVLRVILSYFLIPLLSITGICIGVGSGWVLLCIIEGAYVLYIYHRL